MAITTIYQPSFMRPDSECRDFSTDQIMSAQVNGLVIDSYRLYIKKMDNTVLYDTAQDVSIPNSNINIGYSGSWSTNQNQIIDDTNSQVSYYGYGWNAYSDQTGTFYNNTSHQSSTANDYLLLNFVGTGINCYFTEGKDKGIFQVYVDGVDKGTVDTYISNGTGSNGNNFRQLAYSITNLPLASHTIKILVTGNKNGSSTGSLIEFDYFQVLNTNGSKNSKASGNYLQYTFNSTGINVYIDNTPDSGIVDINIDGTSMGNFDLYSSTYNLNQLVYSNYNLSSGSHTIKLTVTGNKNSQSKDAYIYFESFETLSKTALAQPVYDTQPLSITIPANTITYRGALKWQLTYWNSSNNGENVSSSEMIFTNMSTPTVTNNVPNVINGKSFTFEDTYSQNENIQIKKWNTSLYAVNYKIEAGYFGQNVTGTTIDCGNFSDNTSTKRYNIDCGTW